MPESPPLDKLPDPNAFGLPTNDRPAPVLRDATPADPDRERFVSDGATHVVIADGCGDWVRGDCIHPDDLPAGADIDRLASLRPFPAVRPLTDDEKKGVPARKPAKAEAPAPKGKSLTDPPAK